ncbi:MAG: ATP-binding protein [Chloroflexi bacterium]|nr:ATP-binding protein [Chloroflexota bacterium]
MPDNHQQQQPVEPIQRPVAQGRVIAPGGLPQNGTDRSALFQVETPRRRLADLVLPDHTLNQLRGMLTKIRHHEVLYQDWGLAEIDPHGGRTAINLYGPPGTGKSFAAEAIADELGKGIIRVNYAEIESKYVGETPKNITAAFQKAQKDDALLFFDEADSILGRRLTNVSQSSDHAVNVSRSVMLLALDRYPIVTIFATNLASNYDAAFVRRILGHIEMPLPNAAGRARLWRGHIPDRLPVRLSDADWARLVSDTEGLAGGDILNCVVFAASRALDRDGTSAVITIEDFLAAIAASKRARQEIANPH